MTFKEYAERWRPSRQIGQRWNTNAILNHDQVWSKMWQGLAQGRRVAARGHLPLPAAFFATMLITANMDPTDVQKALRHSTLRITLETYVHWWPKKDRRRNVVGSALRDATAERRPIAGHSAGPNLY